MLVDTSGWTGDGPFTPLLLEALRRVDDAITSLSIEDAPASRMDARYALVANEIFVSFATKTTRERTTRFGFLPRSRTVTTKVMSLADLACGLAATEGIGAPDYQDDGMLQYLRTEVLVAPYQTHGIKVVELVRIYESGSARRG
jgi:hypothetical protein